MDEQIIESENKSFEQEAKDYKDKYLRLLAEIENTKRRLHKEKNESARFALESLILDLLHPLDNLEQALSFSDQMSEETKNWAMGFQMILSQFKEVLKNSDIHSFESLGKNFDPNLHEAVEVLETEEHPDGIILQEFTKGYKSEARVIRAARVKVARHPQSKENNNKIEE